jgi:mRNA-degrading endonuclease toxin of MazEF toxin-antitoxin module
MLEKDFDHWNEKKKQVHAAEPAKFCHPREIWRCSLGVNVGFEQDGAGKYFERPVIVIHGFNERIFFGAALTSREKDGKYYFPIGTFGGRNSFVILSQVRLVDAKRLIEKIGILDEGRFVELKSALQGTLFG